MISGIFLLISTWGQGPEKLGKLLRKHAKLGKSGSDQNDDSN